MSIDDNYLRELSKCYTINGGLVPEAQEYDWLRELGE
jgi:hypothetical protein